VGKGRQIAALIREFFETGGTRALWVSTSTDLRYDARRDLEDVGGGAVEVHPREKDAVPKGRLADEYEEGVLFVTYRRGGGGAGGGVGG
jgi:hypothetical protein